MQGSSMPDAFGQSKVGMGLLRRFRADVLRYFRPREINSGVGTWTLIRRFVSENTLWIIFFYRLSRWARHECTIPVVKFFIRVFCSPFRRLLYFVHDTHIDISADIGPGFYIGHYGGIWVGPVKIGPHCNISHNVTIGVGGNGDFRGVPEIGGNVYIGPGAVLFGKITVGDNAAIGANAVVSKSIPENAVVVGNPARVVGYQGSRHVIDLGDMDPQILR